MKKKTYRVVGTQAIDGHAPGDEFTAAYSREHEQFLIQTGHLEPVKSTSEPASAGKEE